MANETENFDRLLQLLALKRHEQPPPGYFDRLPQDIRLELQTGPAAGSPFEGRLRDNVDWFRRVLRALEARPYLAGVFGVCVCALVLSGIIYSQNLERPETGVMIGDLTPALPLTGADDGLALETTGTNSSISPMASRPVDALFNGGWIKPQPANFHLLPAQ